MQQKLYEIAADFQRAFAEYQGMIDETEEALTDGEIDADEAAARYNAADELVAEYLGQLDTDFSSKVEAVARFIRNLEHEADLNSAQAAVITNAAAPYLAKARAIENKAHRMKLYVKGQMERVGLDKVEGKLLTVRLQNSPPSATVIEPDSVPPKFMLPVQPRFDIRGILKSFAAGEPVSGVVVTQNKHLRFAAGAKEV